MLKPAYKSKTFGVALLNLVALKVFPELEQFAKDNFDAYIELLTITVIILRVLTKKAVKWKSKT